MSKSVHTSRSNELQQYLLTLAKTSKRGPTAEYNESLRMQELQERLLFEALEEEEAKNDRSSPSKREIASANLLNNSTPVIRWAGAAFENSPAPDELPIPSFVVSSNSSPASLSTSGKRTNGSSTAPNQSSKRSNDARFKGEQHQQLYSKKPNNKNRQSPSATPLFYQQKM